METLHNINPTPNMTQARERHRFMLTLTGILTAIICSLVLLKDTHSMEPAATILQVGVDSKIVVTELPVDMKKFEVASVIWLFR